MNSLPIPQVPIKPLRPQSYINKECLLKSQWRNLKSKLNYLCKNRISYSIWNRSNRPLINKYLHLETNTILFSLCLGSRESALLTDLLWISNFSNNRMKDSRVEMDRYLTEQIFKVLRKLIWRTFFTKLFWSPCKTMIWLS